MASYETEHATDPPDTRPRSQHPRRPDLSTFFSTLSQISPDPDRPRNREHAIPIPGDMSAAHRNLAEALMVMRREHHHQHSDGDGDGDGDSDVLSPLIESLLGSAERPPREVEGVDEEYIAGLERISIKSVGRDADCPICGNGFVEDPHPLIVRLPCHKSHVFDLECVRPWLRLKGTCPLDRVDLASRQRERRRKHLQEIKEKAKPEDEAEEEWDGLYG